MLLLLMIGREIILFGFLSRARRLLLFRNHFHSVCVHSDLAIDLLLLQLQSRHLDRVALAVLLLLNLSQAFDSALNRLLSDLRLGHKKLLAGFFLGCHRVDAQLGRQLLLLSQCAV